MGVRDITHVDIVAHACSILRVVVVPENPNRLARTSSSEHQGNQVGFWIMCLTNLAIRISPCGIEITQTATAKASSHATFTQVSQASAQRIVSSARRDLLDAVDGPPKLEFDQEFRR